MKLDVGRLTAPTLHVRFFRTERGNEPVREWLKHLEMAEKKAIGEDIKTVQYGWPLGMPLVRKVRKDLWEIRVHLLSHIARIFFTVTARDMVLLHGFVKQSQALPLEDLELAEMRMKQAHAYPDILTNWPGHGAKHG
ncbi:type II toxin-antitoxin system RelE/ParE family toxin [Paraburkholderia phosphatilytica]|uniref:type II toxin-antitoxin system RelE/ParE family toxin n=1 Tax=Paraburkholderia phosphatilytica TaxID=2282883 RepID=UPI000E4F6E3A|nr:type II toxin-antitoxin system RelE/ParE family toxin [Paraburkholderia phosphatilytica]